MGGRLGAHPSGAGHALAWFGHGLLALHGAAPASPHPRPWASSFDRAEARTARPEPAWAVVSDWLADHVWSLTWLWQGPFDRARSAAGALSLVAGAVASRLAEQGVRADRAAAEAVLVAEIAAAHPEWSTVVSTMT
jgi:hypothetical protein